MSSPGAGSTSFKPKLVLPGAGSTSFKPEMSFPGAGSTSFKPEMSFPAAGIDQFYAGNVVPGGRDAQLAAEPQACPSPMIWSILASVAWRAMV